MVKKHINTIVNMAFCLGKDLRFVHGGECRKSRSYRLLRDGNKGFPGQKAVLTADMDS